MIRASVTMAIVAAVVLPDLPSTVEYLKEVITAWLRWIKCGKNKSVLIP